MKYTTIALLAVTLLAGCATFKSDTQRLEAMCVGITTTTQALTLHKDKLSQGQIETVSNLLDDVTPICGEGEPPTATEAELQTIRAAQRRLTNMKEGIENE